MADLREGQTLLAATPSGGDVGPGTKDRDTPFYNPAMATNRDLSVALVAAEAARRGRELDVADVLAGTGARSLRLANEVAAPHGLVVHANDGDPNAVAAIERARVANEIPEARLRTTTGAAHAFLASRRFDVIDLDPFGSPLPFLDMAVRATRHDGLICLTATDTGGLAGTFPRVCRRRYGADPAPQNAVWRREAGLRILAASAVRAAGRFDRAARPVLSVASDHWMRVVVRVRESRSEADAVTREIGHAWLGDGDEALTGRLPPADVPAAGPLWLGPLHDTDFVASLPDLPEPTRATTRLLDVVREEAAAPGGTPLFWADVSRLGRWAQSDPPKRAHLLAALQEAGHVATRCHLEPAAVRTDAPWPALLELVRSLTDSKA
ncbi:MAG: hypothetical protein ACPGQL_10955 [Thermoplasmatota archaeon]